MPVSAALSKRPGAAPSRDSRGRVRLAAVALGLALLAAYHNSFSSPFVFDDAPAITGNRSIHNLAALGDVLSPPPDDGQTVGGRPIVNLTLALNYAIGGESPRGYHVANFLIHLLATLTLFGLARRTLENWIAADRSRGGRLGASPAAVALAIAALWGLHPLLTESVTYIVQRAESLVGLFLLLTLYAFARGVGGQPVAGTGEIRRPGWRWLAVAFVACLLGMATKEVMVSAPLLVLLYDRIFVAGSWRETWSRRGRFYLALASTWLLLGWLVIGAGNRGGTAGIGAGDSSWDYLLIQCRAVVHYLRLALWPHPLVFDYGINIRVTFAEAVPFALLLVALAAATVFAVRRGAAAGFAGAWFFALLAPSSSVVPIAVQPMAEHRMYLPMAAVVALGVTAAFRVRRARAWWLLAPVAVALGALTVARNADYGSALRLWQDTVAKQPGNARAHSQLGDAVRAESRIAEALAHYTEAVRRETAAPRPGGRSLLAEYLVNQGSALFALGRADEAVQALNEAVRQGPWLKQAHYNLGCVRLAAGDFRGAAECFEAAIRLDPRYVTARTNLGSVLLSVGKIEEAVRQFAAAAEIEPGPPTRANLGLALIHHRQFDRAIAELQAALRLDPNYAPAHEFLGDVYVAMNHPDLALPHYERAAALDPRNGRTAGLSRALREGTAGNPRRSQ